MVLVASPDPALTGGTVVARPQGTAMELIPLPAEQPENASRGTRSRLWARSRLWPLTILAATGATTLALLAGLPTTLGLIVVGFVLTCPGMAIVRLLGLGEPLLEIVLGVALSVALAGLISVTQVYVGAWSPGGTLAVLVAITVGALLLDPLIVPRRAWSSLWGSTLVRGRRLLSAYPPSGPATGPASPTTGPDTTAKAAPGQGQAATGQGPAPAGAATAVSPPPEPLRPLPPPPVAVVRRRPPGSTPVTPHRGRGRRVAFGIDPLEQRKAPRALRTTIDHVIDDFEDREDERNT